MNQGRIIAISGATAGIGYATLQACVANNHRVVFSGRRADRVREIEQTHNRDQVRTFGYVGNALDPEHLSMLFELARDRFCVTPDAFVLCAGRGLPGSLATSDPGQWENLLQTNLLAAMQQLRACAERFIAAASDANPRDIVVIGSTVGRTLSAANPVYGATKCALHYLVESLRQELCSRNIRVSLIEPGFVCTEFQASAGYDMNWFSRIKEEQGPLLSASDIARIICFVIDQPPHVHIDDLRIRPTRQRV